MAIRIGYRRFGGSRITSHLARSIVPRYTIRIVLGAVVIAVRTVSCFHATGTECRRYTVVNLFTVGIRSLRPGTATRLGGRTIVRTGSGYVVVAGFATLLRAG